MSTVTRRDLIEVLVAHTGVSGGLATRCVELMFEGMREAIIKGHRVEIRGFGSWTVREMDLRPNARNPRTGERISVPARRKVMFRPGKALRGALSRPPTVVGEEPETVVGKALGQEPEMSPMHVAHRGFEYGLSEDRIYRCIARELGNRITEKATHRLWPGEQVISAQFTRTLVECWKLQYSRGDRVVVPTELLSEIDGILEV